MVRTVQRQQAAEKRKAIIEDIMNAREHDINIMHKIIKRQRSSTQMEDNVLVDGRLVTEPEEVREAWAEYFDALSTPESTSEQEVLITDAIRRLCQDDGDETVVTPLDTAKAIKALNTGKAADQGGFSAEHLKFAPSTWPQINDIMDRILQSAQVPSTFKSGYKIPIPKKDKNALYRENNRGITVTSIFGKTLEHVVLDKTLEDFNRHNSNLQFGLTADRAPTMASLSLTECIAEAKDNGTDLFVASLDARKAFDVVSHPILKRKLYTAGIKGRLWRVIDDLHSGASETVRVAGGYSRSYAVEQGVRQGGVLSTSLYKLYINGLLSQLESTAGP